MNRILFLNTILNDFHNLQHRELAYRSFHTQPYVDRLKSSIFLISVAGEKDVDKKIGL